MSQVAQAGCVQESTALVGAMRQDLRGKINLNERRYIRKRCRDLEERLAGAGGQAEECVARVTNSRSDDPKHFVTQDMQQDGNVLHCCAL